MEDEAIRSFREKLEKQYQWPSLYKFKFIVPKGKEDQIKALFPRHEVKEKSSSQGNYTSLTINIMAPSSDSVIDIYIQAHKVEGVIAL